MNPIQSVHQLLFSFLLAFLDRLFRCWMAPAPQPSLVLDSLADLARPKSQLILENAFLRQQLVILQRQVKPPISTAAIASAC